MVAIRDTPSCQPKDTARSNQSLSIGADMDALYQAILQSLKRRLSLFVWQGFFEPLVPISLVEDLLTIAAPSIFHKDWIVDHYVQEMSETASNIMCRFVKVAVIHNSSESNASPAAKKKMALTNSLPSLLSAPEFVQFPITPLRASQPEEAGKFVLDSNPINSNYNFDTFVPGPSNQVAFAACNAVAEQPGTQYSPLFLFGPVGIGKTHLIQAIALSAKAQNPNARIVYMSAEQWVNAYIQAIRERRFDAFRKKFRTGCDLLLIDDIQFLAGKDASQDEFFHTFNSLHQAHKQIVVTSDKYPHEIEGLEERLKTRLSWGLVADIRPPEIETRIAILHKKADACSIKLPGEVAHYLASQVSSSVRELEGALLRLSAFLSVSKKEISLEATKEYLSPVLKGSSKSDVTIDQICDLVSRHYAFSISDLKGKSRQQPITMARQVAMSLCRGSLTLSLPEIGRFFNRDHSTVLVSIRKIEKLRTKDIGFQNIFSQLEKNIFCGELSRR
jgi:chromosomal replication initiator protein